MRRRRYDFELPYHVPGMYVSAGRSQLEAEGVWGKLPRRFRQKLERASFWEGVSITRADCDSIDDATWGRIARKLGLGWGYE